MRKFIMPGLIGLVGLTLVYLLFFKTEDKQQETEVFHTVKKESFPIHVVATGELDSKKSVKIRGPQGMQAAGIYRTTISDLAAEGTQLKAGDYVATLDRTELANRMGDIQVEIDKIETQLEQAKIDTAIELRGIRDEIVNNQFGLKEKKLSVELNKFEAQSVIRQTQLDLERSERDYQQLLERYELKKKQSVAKVMEIQSSMNKNQRSINQLQELASQFSIKAPSDGMLIYHREWNGKVGPGSQINAWNPIIAQLPDLSQMISKIYVNEVDISKVSKGQTVDMGIDAFPDLEYTGTVVKVANIGEQVRGYDTKVFEVIVQVHESDSIMRPAMTTSNKVLTSLYEDVLSVPLEAIHSDSLNFVYKKSDGKLVQQEVILGQANYDAIIIEHGLELDDVVLISSPDKSVEYDFVPIDPSIKDAIEAKLRADLAKRKAEAAKNAAMVSDAGITASDNGGGGGIIIIN
ncbi:MAG: efflux RND transporter periplasmic adaptor subunit [Bacteroidota bacterium]